MATAQKQDWHHKGSSFYTPLGTFCLSWWCPCIVYGRTRHRMKTNGDMEKYSCCNTSCAAFCGMACVGLSWILPLTNRGDVREKYDLAGNDCKDCLCTCFCGLCDISQQDKEVEYRERQNKSLLDQPGKVDSMNYRAEWTQPQPHSYYG